MHIKKSLFSLSLVAVLAFKCSVPTVDEVNQRLKDLASAGKFTPNGTVDLDDAVEAQKQLKLDITTVLAETENGEPKYVLLLTTSEVSDSSGNVELLKDTMHLLLTKDAKDLAIADGACTSPCVLTTGTRSFFEYKVTQ